MRKIDYDAIKRPVRYCAASGRDLRAILWPPKVEKVKERKERTPLFGHFIWRALAYILVALFAGTLAVAGGLITRDRIDGIYSFIGDKLEDALD